MEIFDLNTTERKTTGKGAARTLRRQGLIPAVLYGPKTETVLLSVSSYDLDSIYKKSESEHVILNLTVGDGSKKTVMIKETQTSPVSREDLHVDFYEIAMDEEIVIEVAVQVTGKSKGVERGGFLQVVRHHLEVSCLPADIPAAIEVDITELDIGDAIHVEEIEVSGKFKLLYDANFTVATVLAPTVEEEVLEEELEEGEEGEEGEAAEGEEATPEEPAEK